MQLESPVYVVHSINTIAQAIQSRLSRPCICRYRAKASWVNIELAYIIALYWLQ